MGQKEIKNTNNTQTKDNPEKANNAKHGKTKLPWFSCLIQRPGNEMCYNTPEPTQGA